METDFQIKMLGSQYKVFEGYPNFNRPVLYRRRSNNLLYLVVVVLILGVILTSLNVYQLHRMRYDNDIHHSELVRLPELEIHSSGQRCPNYSAPIVWIQGSLKSKNNGPTGYLKHIYNVFEKMGFTVRDRHSDWVIVWMHDYPFITFSHVLKNLKPYQKVNHFPGSGYITNKVSLAQTNLDFIPKAFEIPAKKKEFLEYAERHKNSSWVQKSNQHRGILVKTVENVDLSKDGTFVQEYISQPFTIDGHKFDIGIYTVLTSIDPLRVYVIDGEALFRFCPEKYYPFDSSILDKYVVGDDYLPLWNVPSLRDLYSEQGFSFKNTFNEYLRRVGRNSTELWAKLKSAIRDVALTKEPELIRSVKKYPSKQHFFELIRFDFVADEHLNIFLMEGNMSPNLSSDHYIKNAWLYEHVIFNLLGLVGVGYFTSATNRTLAHEEEMLVSFRDIQVFPDYCSKQMCLKTCEPMVCKLCKFCLSKDFRDDLKIAYLEHTLRGSARRIFPPPISQELALAWAPESRLPISRNLNLKNKLMFLWFIGKCRMDSVWCN